MNLSTDYPALDSRVYLFLLIAGAAAGMFARSETAMLAMFGVALVFHLLDKRLGRAIGYAFGYAVLWGLTKVSLVWLTATSSGTALSLSNLGVSGRRAMVPVLFVLLLARVPVGSFMAALHNMHLPKAISIGLATVMRFFPTLAQEYRSIRNAQKFRGVGVGFWNTLFHLPRVLNCLLIPLIIRITKISEELSASVTVRGVRFGGEVTSFRLVRFTKRDMAFLVLGITAFLIILSFDYNVWGGTAS